MTTRLNNRRAALLMACSILAGCQMQPDYRKPDVRLPDQWNRQYSGQADPVGVGKGDVFWADSRLRTIVSLALENNRGLERAALNLRKTQELYGIERLSRLPAVSASFTQTSAHQPDGLLDTVDTGPLTYHQYDAKLVSASWELDFWGRLQSMKDAAFNDYLATAASERALRLTVEAQSASSYLTLLAEKESLRLAEKKASNLRMMQDMLQSSYQLGDISREAVIGQETALRRQLQEIASLRSTLQKEFDALQLLLGGKLHAAQADGVLFSDIADFSSPAPALPASVLLQRPDVIAAEFRIKQANADIGTARAAFFPSISLTASGGSSSAELKNLFSAGTAAWAFSPNISLPIFNNGRNVASLRASEAAQKAAISEYEKTVQQAFRDTSDALAARQAQKARFAESQILSENKAKVFIMTEQSAASGERSRFDCLDAENALLDAKREATESRLQVLLQEIQLNQALGGRIVSA